MGNAGLGGAAFRLLWFSTVLGFGGYSLLLSVVPLWVAHGGSVALGAGASTGVFMLLTVLSQLGVPSLLRRLGHRWVLGLGIVLVGAPAPALALALSAALAAVLALSAARGVGFGLLTVAGAALVAELVPARDHGRASALFGLAIGVPQLTLLPLGVPGVQRFGFAAVLVAGALPLLALPFVLFIRAAGGVTPARSPAPDMPDIPARRWRVGPVAAMLACATAQGGLVTFLPLATGAATVSLALFGTAVGSLVGRVAAGELADRFGLGGRLLAPGVAVALVGMLAEALSTGGSALVAGGAVLVGIGFGLVQNDSLVVLFAAAGPARYSQASAIWNIAYDAGTGLGALGLGAVAQASGFRAAFAVAAAFLLVTAPSLLRRAP